MTESSDAPSWRIADTLVVAEGGRLSSHSLIELLTWARSSAFSGTLFLKSEEQPRTSIALVGGHIADVYGPEHSLEAEAASLASSLPAEQIQFALDRARAEQSELLETVQRLSLLPPKAVQSARSEVLIAALSACCKLPDTTRYGFEANAWPRATPEATDSIGAIAACAHASLDDRRAKRTVATFGEECLRLRAGTARGLLATLNGPPRAVVGMLARRPRSPRALVMDGAARVDWVVTTLYALWLNQLLEVQTTSAEIPVPVHTETRSLGGSAEVGTSVPSESQSRLVPPRFTRSSAPPPPQPELGPAEVAAKESAMEKRVVEAWMAAESNPSRTEKAARFAVRAAAVYPKNVRIQFFAARLEAQIGELVQAARRLQLVLRMDPDNDDARRELEQVRLSATSPARGESRLRRLLKLGRS